MKSSAAAPKKSNKAKAKAAKAAKSKKPVLTKEVPEAMVAAPVEVKLAKAEKITKTEKAETVEKQKPAEAAPTSGRFRKLHLWLAGLYALQGMGIIVAGIVKELPINLGFVSKDSLASAKAGETLFATGSHHLFDVSLAQLVATFLFISAIVHFLIATSARQRHESRAAQGINNARWFQFATAGGMMLVTVATLVGITDLAFLLVVFGAQLAAGLIGLALNFFGDGIKPAQRLLCRIGIVVAALPWVAISMYLGASVAFGTAGIPAYIYGAYCVTLVYFVAFALMANRTHKKQGQWNDYAYSERAFLLVSFFAQTVLAWVIFAGALRP